MISLQEGIAT